MPTIVVFDCESDSKPVRTDDRGGPDFQFVQCTVVCAIELDTKHVMTADSAELALSYAKEITCWRDVVPAKGCSPFKELFDAFDNAELIVGYNSLDFDMPLLWKHYGSKGARRYMEHRLKSLDIFSRIRTVTNVWPKLEKVLASNHLGSKSGDGAKAIKLWEENKRSELREYCMQDVRLTAHLALLPRLRLGGSWIPSHVYGAGPALQAIRASYAATSCNSSATHTPASSPTQEATGDEVFVFVPYPDGTPQFG